MVSPMREKRAWPPVGREVDAAESVAQFEATVAVAKQTVAKSGEMLVSVKEDLSDHQRWLQMQAAAAEADRARHERWLKRQHERRESEARREEARERRRAIRRRIFGRAEYAGLSVLIAVVSAWSSVTGRVKRGVFFVTGSVGSATGWTGAHVGSAARAAGRQAQRSTAWTAARLQQAGGAAGQASARAFGHLGNATRHATASAVDGTRKMTAGISAKVAETAPIVGAQLSAKSAAVAAQARDATAALRQAVGSAVADVSGRLQSTGPALGERFGMVSAGIGARAAGVSDSAKRLFGGGYAGLSTKLRDVASSLHPAEGKSAAKARDLTKDAPAEDAHMGAQSALDRSIPAAASDDVKARAEVVAQDNAPDRDNLPDQAIDWLFDDAERALADRSLFAVEEVPGGLRLEGFSFMGVNRLDVPLTALVASVKPDFKAADLQLVLHVAEPDGTEGAARSGGTVVPPRGLFRLAFSFPPEALEEEAGALVASYGALTLKLSYRVAGEERSVTRQIAPSLLDAQLAEIPESDNPPIARF